MKLPFWDRISDGIKQFLAIAAVLQALVFVVNTPLSIFYWYIFDKTYGFGANLTGQVRQTDMDVTRAVYLEIIGALYQNAETYKGREYKEECDDWPPVSLDGVDICSEMAELDSIVNFWASAYGLSDSELESVREDLAIYVEFPVSNESIVSPSQ